MRTIDLDVFMASTRERATLTGVDAIPDDDLRNKGSARTARKTALLQRARDRVAAARR